MMYREPGTCLVSRIAGHVEASTHFSDNRVNPDLAFLIKFRSIL